MTYVIAALGVAATATPAAALNDLTGNAIPNTTPGGELSSGPTVQTVRGTPFSPASTRPYSESPEDALAAQLRRIATAAAAADLTTANEARSCAVAILGGTAISQADCGIANPAFAGIPLLNHDSAAKTKVVPSSGPVVVNLVRFGEHQVSDTWRLDLSQRDPNAGFEIDYRITELGGAEGGDLAPTPLVEQNGNSLGGFHSVVTPLTLGELALGTSQTSRFTSAIAGTPLAGVLRPEHTRLATQSVRVRMPPPKHTSAILDPNLRPDHEALSVLRPTGFAPTVVGIAQLADAAPEKQIWQALQSPFSDTTQAAAAASQQLPNVATMRVKSHLPPGIAPDPSAQVTVAFVNNEVYLSDTNIRLAPGAPITITFRNADKVTHAIEAVELRNLDPKIGATNWGEFRWGPLTNSSVVPATDVPTVFGSQTITVTPDPAAFTLVVGDPSSGDQARAFITLDRGPDHQSFKVPGPASTFPLRGTSDPSGNVWVTLSGVDRIGKLTPAPNLAASTYVEYHLPPPPPFAIAWEPSDVKIDRDGIVWATLAAGNAILRLDPNLAEACNPFTNPNCAPSTINGIEIIPLDPCPESVCRPPPPPEPVELTREPGQVAIRHTPAGTEVWFTEILADSIGVVRRLGPGSYQQRHFSCGCKVPPLAGGEPAAGTPAGIGVDPAGNIWFTAATKNTLARLTPPVDPFSSVATIDHFAIPSGSRVNEPEIGGEFFTSIPHSVAVDPAGRIWYSELGEHKVGYLEPWRALPGTTEGMREFDIDKNDFGAFNQPADLVSDPAGTIFVADEYGDELNAVTRCGPKASWRPTRRLSFAENPIVDPAGNLWVVESGSNLLTRIAGVAARPGAPDSGAGCDPFGPPPTTAGPAVTTAPTAVDPVAVACRRRNWAFGTRRTPRILLLGNTAAKVTSCLGRPTAKKGRVWRYGNRLQVNFTAGRVTSFVVRHRIFASAASMGGIRVGSPVSALRRLSTAKVTLDRSKAGYTTVLSLGRGVGARIQYAVAKRKVTRITVTQVRVRR